MILSLVAATLLAAPPTPTPQATPRAPEAPSYASFIAKGLERFDDSATARRIRFGMDAARLTRDAAEEESPLSIESELSQTVFQPNPDPLERILFPRKLYSSHGTNRFLWHTRSGFDAALEADLSYDRLQAPPPGTPDDPYYQVTLSLSYDLFRGGAEGREWTESTLSGTRALQGFREQQQSLLDSRVDLVRLMTDLYVSSCQIAELRKAQDAVARTVREGKVQVQTKTISYKDYLNFLELESSFARRIVGMEATRRTLTQQLGAFGPEVAAHGATLPKTPVCTPDLDATLKRAGEAFLDEPRREQLAKTLPSTGAAETAIEAAQLERRLTELSLSPAVTPFLNTELSRPPGGERTLGSVLAGFQFAWNVPGRRGDLTLGAADRSVDAATAQRQEVFQQNLTRLNVVAAELLSQRDVVPILRQSVRNSEELLKTLDTQRAIGVVDSLSFTSAYLNSIDARLSILESWGILEKGIFELRLLANWSSGHE